MAKTSCDWIVERLPWWANGTLEEGEAERAAAHLDECAACREELAETREAMALYAAHLPIETLLDLAEGGAGEAAGGGEPGGVSRAAADVHLGHCAECREELALLRESRAEVAADAEEEGAKVTAFTTRRPAAATGAGGWRGFDRRAVALAASILVAVVAAGGWLSSHRAADERGERLAELERQWAEARAAEEAAERNAPASTAAASAEELAAAAERAAAEREAAERRIEELEAEHSALLAQVRSDDPGPVFGVRTTYSWNVVTYRGERRPAPDGPVFSPPAGEEFVFLHFDVEGDRPLRLVIEDSAGRLVAQPRVQASAGGDDLGPGVALRLDGLPAGTLRLRIFADGEEIARGTLHNER